MSVTLSVTFTPQAWRRTVTPETRVFYTIPSGPGWLTSVLDLLMTYWPGPWDRQRDREASRAPQCPGM